MWVMVGDAVRVKDGEGRLPTDDGDNDTVDAFDVADDEELDDNEEVKWDFDKLTDEVFVLKFVDTPPIGCVSKSPAIRRTRNATTVCGRSFIYFPPLQAGI